MELGLKKGSLESGGLHVEPRSGRRFPAGRAGAADRLGQGRRADDAARGPLGPRAGRLADDARADPQSGGARGGRRARGHAAGRIEVATPDSRSMCSSSTWSRWRWAAASAAEALREEVRRPARIAKSQRTTGTGRWTFVRQGGKSLTAYPDYRARAPDEEGVWRVREPVWRGATDEHRHDRQRRSIAVKFWSRGGRRWARSKRASSHGCGQGTCSCSAGDCWSSCASRR